MYVLINPPAGTTPSTSYSQYSALGSSGVELITIKASPVQAATACYVGATCTISIAVYGSIGGSYK